MKVFYWIENAEGELFYHASMQLARLYGGLGIVGYTASVPLDSCIADGKELRFVEKPELKDEDYDVLFVIGKNLRREKVLQECQSLGIDTSNVVFDFEACIPGFSLGRANRLHRCHTSILAINSWGRKMYERFQLPMRSPFMNSAMTTPDWLEFLEAPQEHLAKELVFCETLGTADGREFPVFTMGEGGLKVYMLYETDEEKIRQQWAQGVQTVSWQDLLVMTYTDSQEVLERFDRLPYRKKICFTSFESQLSSAFYLPPVEDEEGEDMPLWASVDELTKSSKPYYDLWDMLLYGRKTLVN